MKVVLAGGSGALGRAITPVLSARGDEVVVLTRRIRDNSPFRQVEWDGRTVGPWKHELEDAAVVNLAGELVDRRPTRRNIELLTTSRVEPTLALRKAIGRSTSPFPWIQLSTLAIYGDAGETVLDEDSPLAEGPPQMAGVARAWESAAAGVEGRRRTILRTGIVLQRRTPALDRLELLVKVGLGGRIGSGRQWISWIHVDDFVRVVLRVLDDERISGVIHATSPSPVRNVEFMKSLRRVGRRPMAPPTPEPLVRIGARVLNTDPLLGLTGRRCIPHRLSEMDFGFDHPEIDGALDDLFPDE